MKVAIDEIHLKKRVRKNLGDLSQLMLSMKNHGLMNPIVITNKYELIAGHRRYESAKRLGWVEIEARIIAEPSKIEKLELELDENVHRRNLSPDELADGYTRLNKLKNPGIFVRIWRAIVRFFKRLFRIKD
ncbi:MAG: ParB N-terminal domain-containing protein [Spirochaetales bacterium]|nr:ParB N-terminal domain-containing protein [Spirochaetales bacterium]